MIKESKKNIIFKDLAELFIYMEIDEKIPTISQLVDKYEVGTGTVQAALQSLTFSGAVELQNFGSKGTRIVSKDIKRLVELVGTVYFTGIMPLPYSKHFEGLSTGLHYVLNKPSFQVNFSYQSGSHLRIKKVLTNEVDFTITSLETAEKAIKNNPELEIYEILEEESYISKHMFIFNKDFENDNDGNKVMRIGIDTSSPDQSMMTIEYCVGKNIQLIPIEYTNTLECLKENQIDGAIWSGGDVSDEFNIEEIEEYNGKQKTRAAFVGKEDNLRFKKFFNNFFNLDEVREIQNDVINGNIMPNY
ncbi:GntR family transcriptional regulator YhfZ [Carnobacteriaceae bacterium 52-44]